jgi:hypothetical protein
LNPPNGSWGMFKIQPSVISRAFNLARLNFNHPLTSVGGIADTITLVIFNAPKSSTHKIQCGQKI